MNEKIIFMGVYLLSVFVSSVSQVLLKKLTCVMRDLESAINDAYEDDNGDIRGYFEEAQRLVEAMQSISSRAEGQPEK